jgi:hypothetical protein
MRHEKAQTGIISRATHVVLVVLIGLASIGTGMALATSGGLPLCQKDLSTCQSSDQMCDTSLVICDSDLSTSNSSLSTCNSNLSTCNSNLSSCEASDQKFPASGAQRDTYPAPADDGALQKGAPLSYTANGDGTITDNNTKLMWEAKDGCDGTNSASDLHDGDNYYQWAGQCSSSGDVCEANADCLSSETCNITDGQGTGYTIFTWVAALNAAKFAGYDDWRIPNVREMQSIVDYGLVDPAIDFVFTLGGAGGCMPPLPNPGFREEGNYWSSSVQTGVLNNAWQVSFFLGIVDSQGMVGEGFLRAVRGGS